MIRKFRQLLVETALITAWVIMFIGLVATVGIPAGKGKPAGVEAARESQAAVPVPKLSSREVTISVPADE